MSGVTTSPPRVGLLLPSVALFEALLRSRAEFAALLGASVPDGWPELPQIVPFTLDVLHKRPAQAPWWTYLFVYQQLGSLVGSGGLKGPPVQGVAEIGYEIAPSLRGRGYATEAARLLIAKGVAGGAFSAVEAHTLAEVNASVAVLRKHDFHLVGSVTDPDSGALWHWRRPTDRPVSGRWQ